MSASRERVLIELDSMGVPEQVFGAGDTLIREGTSGREVYVLRDGVARVSYGEREVAVIDEPGAVLGELAALLDSSRTATVTVVEPGSFFVINDLPGLLEKHSSFAIVLMRELAEQILGRETIHADVYIGLSQMRKSSGN
ncbi:MAG: cyclic nucleotide-binding domain-containing protein [Lentisphaerae bacterium]|jgi:CRP/FNR family transcriptional regulator, cyclic AMP receptor protein|nr:cyclic nucleotide-binding domain-containing protein [Lentisphaerota bacterium]MBT5606866.1 cyclic nucleotide-binding domain-containing protein [Lentisphaerota bacterium]MBT7059013.1 cyclic nucleotide-binding domain-containing protein [Lentisphaerota bacterium]MBT7843585.1 cyclic nucleotide-binding domain-containing protein [Lentisphaerota bacterium]